jgi:hypothetical protein
MNISSLDYTHSYQGYIIKVFSIEPFRNFFKIAPLGNYIGNKIIDWNISMFTKMLLEVSGVTEFINILSKNELNVLLTYFNKLLPQLEKLNNQDSFFQKNQKTYELGNVIRLLTNKVKENILHIEENIHTEYTYTMSVNHIEDDWNDALNDHWDNY